jgi:hypothetical protein
MKREMQKETRKVIDKPRAIDLPAESVPPAQILEALGLGTAVGGAPTDVVRSTLESIDSANVMIADGLVQPRLIAAEYGIDRIAPDGIVVNGHTIIPCDGSLFEGAERVIAAIVTLGPRLERAVKSAFAGNDPLSAIILDMAGTMLIRNASTHFQRECAARAGAIGLELGPRVCPGCQAVPLEAQKALFSLLDAQSVGVTLTDSLLMTPVKSVSLILPLAASLPERLRVSSMCHTCRHSNKCAQIIL